MNDATEEKTTATGEEERKAAEPGAAAPGDAPGAQSAHSVLGAFILIARHHGVDLSFPVIRQKYAVSGAEVAPSLLLRIGQDAGFIVREKTLAWRNLSPASLPWPALGILRDGRGVIMSGVEEGEKKRLAHIDPAAPAAGFAWAGEEEWNESFSGRVFTIKRRYALDDESQPFGLRWFIPEILRLKSIFRDVAVNAVMLNVFALASPFFFQILIDKVLTNRAESTLYAIVSGMLVVVLFDALLSWIKNYMLLSATTAIDLRLSKRTYGHLLSLPVTFFEKSSAGVLLKHMQQTERIRGFLTGSLFMTMLEATVLIVLIPVMLFYSVFLTLLVLAFTLLIALIFAAIIPPYRSGLTRLYGAEAERQALLVESMHGMNTIKSMALEPLLNKDWGGRSAKAALMQLQVGKLGMSAKTATNALNKLMQIAVPWAGVSLVIDGSMSVGALIAFNMLASRVSTPLVQMVSLINEYQQIVLSVGMLANIMNAPPERAAAARGLTPKISGRIELEGVSFNYDQTGDYALRDINLTVLPGEILGIVGRSGSGKSTLTRLVQGMYQVRQGIIRIDGFDQRELDLPHLRSNIGVVLQESFMFKGSVRQNISLARPGAGFEHIVLAARQAGADEFIQRLPQGYDTVLAENAANLSGGQKQRLAIARALLTNPSILILDEATSALDAESESILQENLPRMARGRTLLIVSHRLSMLSIADRILVMDKGRITGQGAHRELMQGCELYRTLWDKQHQHLRDAETES
jgi:ATP-binding cassette subfamily B protein